MSEPRPLGSATMVRLVASREIGLGVDLASRRAAWWILAAETLAALRWRRVAIGVATVGLFVGAIGVSGGTSQQDGVVAAAAVATLA